MTDESPRIDPVEAAQVQRMMEAIDSGSIDLPGIGTAKILSAHSASRESFPPQRTTVLTLELRHRA